MESLIESFIQALMRQVRGPVLCHGHLLRQNITTARNLPRRWYCLIKKIIVTLLLIFHNFCKVFIYQ